MARVKSSYLLNSSAPLALNDVVNSVIFTNDIFGEAFPTGVLAVTYYWSGSDGTLTEADVLFNKAQPFDSYRGILLFGSDNRAIYDIRRVLLHDLGHALGLNHPDRATQDTAAIMTSVQG